MITPTDHTHRIPHVAVVKDCIKDGKVHQLGGVETTRVTIFDSDAIHCTNTEGREGGNSEFSISTQ